MPANGRWDLIRRLKFNILRCTDLERGSSGKRTGTEEGAQFKSSEIKENRARIK